ncbi:MAG TPA: glycosyltransferase, partial [Tepidisphaeraceae bacterium]|nr:glycosyltransferase [Tepidisphaeraceae bacterium]
MAERAPIAILILTKNEEINLPVALASVADWAQQVFVLDSGSTDRTEQIAGEYGATFVNHPWEGYARQKNWGLDNLPITAPWVFILDADESVTSELRDELVRIAAADSCAEDAFYVNRYLLFMGKRIRHCGYYPSWNLRFFRHGKARYEEREVHEHMICTGQIGYLKGAMQHIDRRGLEHFIAKHNHYSTLEAREIFRIQKAMTGGTMRFSFWAGPIERRRWIKHKIWPRVPFRSLARFIYMYLLRFGFLDGRAGFHLCIILAVYEHQITVKLDELWRQSKRLKDGNGNCLPPAPPPPQPAPALPQPQYNTNGIKLDGQAKEQTMESFRDRFGADTTDGERWPYPKHVYVMRLIWAIVWRTLWRVCWWRIPILRTTVLRLFGAKIGSVGMSGSTWIEMPWDLEIGENCIVGPRASLYNLGGLSIGDHTVISQDVYVCGGTHDYTDPTYPLIRLKTTIGSYVWIAAGAFIHPGVTIGDGAVIGARAVVTKDVPPWTVVSGHPAK